MTLATLTRRPMAIGTDTGTLGHIMTADIHLALWQRPRPPHLDWLDSLSLDAIDHLDFPVPVAGLEPEVAEGLIEAGYPLGKDTSRLGDEIVALARDFARIVGCDRLKLRLEVVETDACRKFHADAVTARLISTLCGSGTDWIEATAPEHIHRLTAGDVAIFKGRLWAEEPAILHRSPPIAGTGEKRLLLVLDPIFDRQAS